MDKNYDVIIIGAGMSGLSAAIRLAMFDKKVCVLEKHSIPGGLNSYYQRKNDQQGGVRQFDVGLHALTNYIEKGTKGAPFSKLLKQLRFEYDSFELCPQKFSTIHFEQTKLHFTNEFEFLVEEVRKNFPAQIDQFLLLAEKIKSFNELDLSLSYQSARSVLDSIFSDKFLIEMILAPLLIYGSAWEDDMDFGQFVVMFKSIYFEGFARPKGGVRTIIHLLTERLEELGGEIEFRNPVQEIVLQNGKVAGVKTKNGFYQCSKILSSAGYPESLGLIPDLPAGGPKAEVGQMTFLESIFVFKQKPMLYGQESAIVFYNQDRQYRYHHSESFFDERSAVVCFPDNYELDKTQGEGTVRVTFIANYDQWKKLEKADYNQQKEIVAKAGLKLIDKLAPNFPRELFYQDVFSPITIEKFTWHKNGAVYGSPTKLRDGRTHIPGLFIMGTDQGFLGIVGSMLSGISMANMHGLMGDA